MAGPWEKYAAQAAPAEGPWTKYAATPAPTQGGLLQVGKDALGGLVRGAGSIGAVITDAIRSTADVVSEAVPANMRPEVTADLKDAPRGEALRAGMDASLRSLGANPESLPFQAGKLTAEIAGTAGAGNVLARPVQALANTRFGAGIEPLIDGVAKGLQTGGFRVGSLAGTSAAIPARIATGAATGAATVGLANPEDAGMGAVIGGAMPAAVQAAGRAGAGIRNAIVPKVAPEVRQLAQRAEELGIRVPADRIVDSRPVNALAAGLNYVPFSGRAATEDAMTSQLNRALSKTFGQDSSNVTGALRKADDVLGSQFDDFLRNNKVLVDRRFLDDLAEASNQAANELGADGASIINKQVAEIVSRAGSGQIDGQAAYNIKRTLDRIGRRPSPEAWYALDLKGKLMDALNRSVGDEKAASFKGLRQQYGNMIELQKLAKNGVEGEVSVARLANLKNIRNPELQELADIAAQFVKAREGQHGAAQRAMVGLGGAMVGGVPGVLAGAAAGRTANALLNAQPVRNVLLTDASGRLLGEPQTMNALAMLMQRSAPLLATQD